MIPSEKLTPAEMQRELLMDGGGGGITSPNSEYIEYILEDKYQPSDLPEDLVQVAYDKEMALSNLRDNELTWLRRQLSRSTIMHRQGRPALAGTYKEEVKLAVLPAKHLVKLARSRGGFERKQETTQTLIRRAEVSGDTSSPSTGRRWKIFGRGKQGGE